MLLLFGVSASAARARSHRTARGAEAAPEAPLVNGIARPDEGRGAPLAGLMERSILGDIIYYVIYTI